MQDFASKTAVEEILESIGEQHAPSLDKPAALKQAVKPKFLTSDSRIELLQTEFRQDYGKNCRQVDCS